MVMERPDLSAVSPEVLAYIESLEQALRQAESAGDLDSDREPVFEPAEPPTTINVITVSRSGLAKRTPRHFYGRQRRGGMGVFGLETREEDPPAFLLLVDESAGLTLVTDQARAFRLPVSDLIETPVHGRGKSLVERFPLRPDEQLALIFADPLAGGRGAYLALVSKRGQVRRIGNQYLGKNLQPGTVLYNIAEGGSPAAACWTAGNDDLFIVTRTGSAIRFGERLVPVRGCLGMRVDPNDEVIGIAATDAEGGVFMLNDEGKGTIRLFSGFGANKAPGASGKTAMKAEKVVGVVAVGPESDLFAISRLGKVIRFRANEVPAKEGVVQGVNCMSLRADECVAVAASP
jgi:DNA gyrase subunit A